MSHSTPLEDTFPEDQDGEDWDEPAGGEPGLPGRPGRRWLTPKSALLLAALVAMIGFYAGIREEKSKASTTTGGTASADSRAKSSATRTGSTGRSLPSFGSTGTAGGATEGTIIKVDGDTVYVKETSGETVKVDLLATTTLSKFVKTSGNAVHPGDTVAIGGTPGKSGTIKATSVTDTGDTSTTTTSSETNSTSAG